MTMGRRKGEGRAPQLKFTTQITAYLLSGFVHNVFIVLGFSAALMLAVLFAIRFFVKRKESRG